MPLILTWQDKLAQLCRQPHQYPELGVDKAHASRLAATYLNEA